MQHCTKWNIGTSAHGWSQWQRRAKLNGEGATGGQRNVCLIRLIVNTQAVILMKLREIAKHCSDLVGGGELGGWTQGAQIWGANAPLASSLGGPTCDIQYIAYNN